MYARSTRDESTPATLQREDLARIFAGQLEDECLRDRVLIAMGARSRRERTAGGLVLVALDDLSDLTLAVRDAIRRAWVL